MVDFRTRPWPEGLARNRIASSRRASASDYSSAYAAVPTDVNADEADLEADGFGTSFTKGLAHDEFGQVADPAHYIAFVNQINQQDAENFDRVPRGIGGGNGPRARRAGGEADGSDIAWRGWESPRAGHYFDLQGPDPDAVGMPPAPELGSEELTAEMAEVYALALLRDVPFTDIADPAGGASDPRYRHRRRRRAHRDGEPVLVLGRLRRRTDPAATPATCGAPARPARHRRRQRLRHRRSARRRAVRPPPGLPRLGACREGRPLRLAVHAARQADAVERAAHGLERPLRPSGDRSEDRDAGAGNGLHGPLERLPRRAVGRRLSR